MNFFREQDLSQAASDLMRFDADSIQNLVSARRLASPDIWLADPDAYEKNGRVLRDSDSPRMLAYSTMDRVLYATDGCNACIRQVEPEELKTLAEKNEVRLDLVVKLLSLIGAKGSEPSSPKTGRAV
jgi:hypothetical protein